MSDALLAGLEPAVLWQRFFQLKDTPRPSKNEQEAMEMLRGWAQERGLEAHSDAVGNLCVQVPASPGAENAAKVTIQNHVDIVVANAEDAGESADSAKGLIPVERGDFDREGVFTASADGGWVYAPLTTLGADNGIGCAMAMALCETEGIEHPPLELLFTVDEEEGMSGALQLDAAALQLTGRRLINLDTEDDDELTIGSAGGCDIHLEWTGRTAPVEGAAVCRVVLKDLRGGHSGIEINSGRANAIRVMARALADVSDDLGLRIVSLDGGDRRNAIPRFCTAVVSVTSPVELGAELAKAADVFNAQYAGRDNTVAFLVEAAAAGEAFSREDSGRLLDLLLTIPTGVFEMTAEIPDLPETSNNLALIATDGSQVNIDCSARSAFDPGMQDVLAAIRAVARGTGAPMRLGNTYPGWKPNLESGLLEATRSAYVELFPDDPKVMAVHAGLECGVLASQMPGLDCISFGPNIRGNHAPGEHVEVASVEKSYRLLIALLRNLCSA